MFCVTAFCTDRQIWRGRWCRRLRHIALESELDAYERLCSGEVAMTPEEVVRAELGAWSSLDVDQIMAHFAPEATWLPGFGFATSSGYDEIRQAVEGFVEKTSWIENEILNLAVSDNVVLTERVDHLVYDGERLDAPGMGTFEVVGEKITAWRDYFAAEA